MNFAFIFRICISVLLLSYCFYLVDMDGLLTVLLQVDVPLFMISTFIAALGLVLFKSLLVWDLFSRKGEVRFREVVKINLVLRFYSIIFPKALVAAMRWYKYKKFVSSEQALVILSFEVLLGLLVTGIGGALFCLFEMPISFKFLLFLLIFTFSVYLILASSRSATLRRSLLFFFGLMPEKLSLKFSELTHRLAEAIHQVDMRGRRGLVVLIVSQIGQYLCFLISAWLLAYALGITLDFVIIAWVRSVVLVLTQVPISIAGLGIRESAFISIFGLYVIAPEVALAYAFASLSVQILIAVLGLLVDLYERLFEAKMAV